MARAILFKAFIVFLALLAVYAMFEIYRFSGMVYGVRGTKAEFTVMGPEKSDLVMVEFLDYNCRFCKEIHPAVTDFLAIRKDVRYIARPIAVLGEDSEKLARAALAAGLQGKFWEMHNALLTSDGQIDDKFYRETTSLYDIDYDKLMADMEGKEVKKMFDDNVSDARRAAVFSTPTIIMNRTFISGSMNRMPTTADFVRIAEQQK